MVPKLALDVMSCEVMRVLQLTDSCIVPISYHVPRKVCAKTALCWHCHKQRIHNRCYVCLHGHFHAFLFAFMCVPFCVVLQNSGQEFHDDLYPDTAGTTPAMSAEEWWQGGNKQVMVLYPQQVYSAFVLCRHLKWLLCLSSGGESHPPPRQKAQAKGSTSKTDACKEGGGQWGEQRGERHL